MAVVVICVLVAVINEVTRRVRRRQRDTTLTAEEWDGWIVAVVLTARHIKSEYSSGQKARVVVRPAQAQAFRQQTEGRAMYRGGYRMNLPDPVPVHVTRDVKGRYWWDITG